MIRAYAEADNVRRFVDVTVVDDRPDGPRVLEVLDGNGSSGWRKVEAGTRLEPTLRMPEHYAREILDALSAHFDRGVPSDARALRADLDAERARVDVLLNAVTTIALDTVGGIT